jgi:hypothetical protein
MRVILLIPFLLLAGCGSEPQARDPETIFQQQQKLDGLYFTRSGKEVTAPLHRGIFIDVDSGEICFPAVACHNPACPERGSSEPYRFFIDDPSVILSGDGSLGTNMKVEITSSDPAVEALLSGHCPACLETRNLTRESRSDWDDYSRFVRPYMPADTRAEMRRLDEERKRSEDAARRKR